MQGLVCGRLPRSCQNLRKRAKLEWCKKATSQAERAKRCFSSFYSPLVTPPQMPQTCVSFHENQFSGRYCVAGMFYNAIQLDDIQSDDIKATQCDVVPASSVHFGLVVALFLEEVPVPQRYPQFLKSTSSALSYF